MSLNKKTAVAVFNLYVTHKLVAQVHSNWNIIIMELVRWLNLSRDGELLAYST
jgi:hypothetical protein